MNREALCVLGLVLTLVVLVLPVVYAQGIVKVAKSKHFIIYSYVNVSSKELKFILKELERAYKIYVNELHLKILPPCGDGRYVVFLGYNGYYGYSASYVKFGTRCVRYINLLDTGIPTIFHELAHAVIHMYRMQVPSWIDENLADAFAIVYGLNATRISDICRAGTMVENETILWANVVPHGFWNYCPPYRCGVFFAYLILKNGPKVVLNKVVVERDMAWLRKQWINFLLDVARSRLCVLVALRSTEYTILSFFNGKIVETYKWTSATSRVFKIVSTPTRIGVCLPSLGGKFLVVRHLPGVLIVKYNNKNFKVSTTRIFSLNNTSFVAVVNTGRSYSCTNITITYANITTYRIWNVEYRDGRVLINATVIENGVALLNYGKPFLKLSLVPRNVTTIEVDGVPVKINMVVRERVVPVVSSSNVKLVLVEKIMVLNRTFVGKKVLAMLDLSHAKVCENGLVVSAEIENETKVLSLKYGINELRIGNWSISISISRPTLTLAWPWLIARINLDIAGKVTTIEKPVLNLEHILDKMLHKMLLYLTLLRT